VEEGSEGDAAELMARPGGREEVIHIEKVHDMEQDLDGQTLQRRRARRPTDDVKLESMTLIIIVVAMVTLVCLGDALLVGRVHADGWRGGHDDDAHDSRREPFTFTEDDVEMMMMMMMI
jgi:hypothetical protein